MPNVAYRLADNLTRACHYDYDAASDYAASLAQDDSLTRAMRETWEYVAAILAARATQHGGRDV